jgi:hypothetical protein
LNALQLGGDKKAWNDKCLELAPRRGRNYQTISAVAREGKRETREED